VIYGAREYVGRETRSRLLDLATVEVDFTAAAGDELSHKIDFDNIEEGTPEWFLCVEGLKQCVHDNYGPSRRYPIRARVDAVITVATGATRLGGVLAAELGTRHIPTYKDADKNFYIDDDVSDIGRAIIVDDVFRTGHNARKVKALSDQFGIRTLGLVAVFNRSANPTPYLSPSVPVHSMIHKNMEE